MRKLFQTLLYTLKGTKQKEGIMDAVKSFTTQG